MSSSVILKLDHQLWEVYIIAEKKIFGLPKLCIICFQSLEELV